MLLLKWTNGRENWNVRQLRASVVLLLSAIYLLLSWLNSARINCALKENSFIMHLSMQVKAMMFPFHLWFQVQGFRILYFLWCNKFGCFVTFAIDLVWVDVISMGHLLLPITATVYFLFLPHVLAEVGWQ